jgi:GTPase Era involved in 16S rRNA processing
VRQAHVPPEAQDGRYGVLLRLLDELLALVDGIAPAASLRDLEAARERLGDRRVNLVVLGEFKRGKSSLVNALLGGEVVPTGVLPLTALATVLRYGERPRLVVSFEDASAVELEPAEIVSFVTQERNADNHRQVRSVVIELPAQLLAEGLQLVDTPGIGSVHAHNTETALAFLPQVDAALFTLAADQPLSAAERGLVQEAAERIPKILFALNRLDQLGTAAERRAAIEFVREQLRTTLPFEPELYPVSARTREGLEALRQRLESFARSERDDTLTKSVRALARSFATEALKAVRFDAHALQVPALELERKLSDFAARASDLERAHEEATAVLRQAAGRLIASAVDEPLLSLAAREGDALASRLRSFAGEQRGLSPRELARAVEAWIERTIHERFELLTGELDTRLATELAALGARHADRVDEILVQVQRATMEIFGQGRGLLAPAVAMREPSRFTFKLAEQHGALDQLASLATVSLPGTLGRRLVLREAEERLRTMLDRHAGRLRSDLADRVRESMRQYERELAETVSEAILSVSEAARRAQEEQARGRASVDASLADLARKEQRISKILTSLVDD